MIHFKLHFVYYGKLATDLGLGHEKDHNIKINNERLMR